jgi:hypothetical protein
MFPQFRFSPHAAAGGGASSSFRSFLRSFFSIFAFAASSSFSSPPSKDASAITGGRSSDSSAHDAFAFAAETRGGVAFAFVRAGSSAGDDGERGSGGFPGGFAAAPLAAALAAALAFVVAAPALVLEDAIAADFSRSESLEDRLGATFEEDLCALCSAARAFFLSFLLIARGPAAFGAAAAAAFP